MLTVRVPERVRNKCERVTGPQPERVRSIFAGVNATRTSGTGPERDRNANRNRCEHGLTKRSKNSGISVGRNKKSTVAEWRHLSRCNLRTIWYGNECQED